MKIDLFIPPAVDDIYNAAGYVVRCKPENDCASLFGPETTTGMYSMLGAAFRDAQMHAKTCANDHAVVVIARGPIPVGAEPASEPVGSGTSSTPAGPRRMKQPGLPVGARGHLESIFCAKDGCVPVEA